eukprot:Nk52_evm87s217 gene=Nk52_evmTU87s217
MGFPEEAYRSIPQSEIAERLSDLRKIFNSGSTLPLKYRLSQLKALQKLFLENEEKIVGAVMKDMGKKMPFECHFSEYAMVLQELSSTISDLKGWLSHSVYTPIALKPSSSKISYEPLGVVLICSPWNYPVNLAIVPLIGAIAAGNCVFLKLSRHAPESSRMLLNLLPMYMDTETLAIDSEGGASYITELISHKWDHIFFTGSVSVGRIVYQAAAKHLTPCTLELGGKNPAIIDKTANLKVVCKRIAWAKFFNCGQTCLAVDHCYVHKDIMDQFITMMKETIEHFYGANPQNSMSYPRIINIRNVERLEKYLSEGDIVCGGLVDKVDRYVAPTIMKNVGTDSVLFSDEIFGPILPLFEFEEGNDLLTGVKELPAPLAVYCFTEDDSFAELCRLHSRSGAFLINDAIVHFLNANLPFGGVGESGLGRYHGRKTFETFSNERAIISSSTKSFLDVPLRYPPYEERGSTAFKLASMFTKSTW